MATEYKLTGNIMFYPTATRIEIKVEEYVYIDGDLQPQTRWRKGRDVDAKALRLRRFNWLDSRNTIIGQQG